MDEYGKVRLLVMKVRPLYRSDYDAESEVLTLKAALHMKSVNGA